MRGAHPGYQIVVPVICGIPFGPWWSVPPKGLN